MFPIAEAIPTACFEKAGPQRRPTVVDTIASRNHADFRPELLRLGRRLTALQRTVLATARLISYTGIPIKADSMIRVTPPAPPPPAVAHSEGGSRAWLPQQECRRRSPLFRQVSSCPRRPARDQIQGDRHDL